MKRQITWLNRGLVCLLLVVLAAVPLVTSRLPIASAAGVTLTSSVQVSFPTAMNFQVNAQSDANVVKLRVHYVVSRQAFASVVSEGWPPFNPAKSVNTAWLWDMRKSSLPPGAQVKYWWTAQDAAGNRSETKQSTISFDDNRYAWQSITNGPVTLLWYSGSSTFANTLMAAAQQGLQRIGGDVGATPKGSVRIYIYASAQALQAAQLFTPEWEGGVTFQGYDIIAIGVSPSQVDYGIRTVPHELTHWIVGQVTFNNYGAGLPTWLDEGLATYGEGVLSPDYQAALNFAIRNNRLISVRSLSSPFSAIANEAFISYGESNSIVTFLIQKYGKAKMVQLLGVFRQGATYDNAIKQVYGFDQDGLDALWRQSIGVAPRPPPTPQPGQRAVGA